MTGEPFPDRFKRWYSMLPPALRVLMTVNTVIYVIWVLAGLLGLGIIRQVVVAHLALHPLIPEVLFQPWQVLTYGFLHIHPGFWGFIRYGFNMLWLYWLGRDYEEFYGSHQLFGLYILGTIGGGLLAVLAGLVVPVGGMPVAGAMAAVLAVLCGIATLNPDRGIALFFIGMVKMKWLAVGFLVIIILFHWGMWGYVATYLGGAAAGFGFIRAQQAGIELGAWSRALFPRKRSAYGGYAPAPERPRPLKRLSGLLRKRPADADVDAPGAPAGRRRRRGGNEAAAGADGSVVDRLLDKINAEGYDSLSEEEKRILYEASRTD